MSKLPEATATVVLTCSAGGEHKQSRLHVEQLEPVLSVQADEESSAVPYPMVGAVTSRSHGVKDARIESSIRPGGMRSAGQWSCPRCHRTYRVNADRMWKWLEWVRDESPTGRVVIDLSAESPITF